MAEYVQLKNGDTLLYPTAALENIIPNKNKTGTFVTQGGIIKRSFVPHDITPLLAVSPTPPEPTAVGDKYYNTVEKKLHTAYVEDEDLIWNEGSTPTSERLFVDVGNNRLFHWHDGDMHVCGDGHHGGLIEGVDYVVLP